MALNLYRRHRLECEASHPEDFRSGEWEERRKGWKRCNCAIHVPLARCRSRGLQVAARRAGSARLGTNPTLSARPSVLDRS